MRRIIISALGLVVGLTLIISSTAQAQRTSPSNYSISSPNVGYVHSVWTNPEWKYRGECNQILITYRFNQMVRKYPMNECSQGKHEHDETGLPPGMYEQIISTGISYEWEATTGFTNPSLNDVPLMVAGPIEL